MIEYICRECDVLELDIKIIPKKKCPKCHLLMEVLKRNKKSQDFSRQVNYPSSIFYHMGVSWCQYLI